MESNKSLRAELNSEINNNILNEKKICKYLQELEQCYKTISSQDSIILSHEIEIQELKSQIPNLEKRLRIALEDIKKKDAYIPYLEQEIANFQDEVFRLKTRIHEIYSKNIEENMARRRANHFDNIQALLGDIRVYILNPRRTNFNQNQIIEKLETLSIEADRLNTLARNNAEDARNNYNQNQRDAQTITELNNRLDNNQRILDLTRTAFLNEQDARRLIFPKYIKWKRREIIS